MSSLLFLSLYLKALQLKVIDTYAINSDAQTPKLLTMYSFLK